MRFNPPPNWPPSPPGWTPPPGWQPDPMWPPPPPGWQLWVEDSAAKSKTPLIIGGVAVAVLVVVGIVLAFVVTGSDEDAGAVASSETTSAEPGGTDEEQIEKRVQEFETAWNNEDFDAIEQIVCEEIKGEPDFNETDFLESRGDTGRINLSYEGADIDGDTAVVDIKEQGQQPQQFDFAKEDGEWKWCEL